MFSFEDYIFIIWIISFGLCIPPMLGVCAYTKSSSVSLCFTKCTLASNFEYIYALIYAFAVLLPIVTILGKRHYRVQTHPSSITHLLCPHQINMLSFSLQFPHNHDRPQTSPSDLDVSPV